MTRTNVLVTLSVIATMMMLVYITLLNDTFSHRHLEAKRHSDKEDPGVNLTAESLLLHPSEQTSLKLPLFLRDIMPDPAEYNIYQVVTSLPDTMKLRHFCSLESYCLENPGATVWYMLLGLDTLEGEQMHILERMQKEYPNLKLASLDMLLTVEGTPLESIVTSGKLEKSAHRANHLSDVIRLAVVSKAGGLYTDFDFICLRSVTDVRNSMALALSNTVMNGLFHFDAGHPFLQMVMVEDELHFNPKLWSWNGPLLFTRILKEYCRGFHFKNPTNGKSIFYKLIMDLQLHTLDAFPSVDSVNATSISSVHDPNRAEELCRSVNLLATSAFMPLYIGGMKKTFLPGSVEELLKVPAASYAVHLFNKITRNTELAEGSALLVLAQRFCPRTLATIQNSSMVL